MPFLAQVCNLGQTYAFEGVFRSSLSSARDSDGTIKVSRDSDGAKNGSRISAAVLGPLLNVYRKCTLRCS